MKIQDSINRGFNLLAVSIVSLASFSFLPEVFLEKDVPDKIDDMVFFLVGLVAMAWYARSTNKFTRSFIPVVLVIIGLAVKIMGVAIEFGDPEALGEDLGGVLLFVLTTAFIIYQYYRTQKLLDSTQ